MGSCPPQMVFTPCPTLAGYSTFLYDTIGIPPVSLPATSEWIGWTYNWALGQVNAQLQQVPGPVYMLCVYNLAAARLFQWCPDVPNALPYKNPPNCEDSLPYFAYWRALWNLNGFVAGVINSTGDDGTSQSMTVSKAFENLTIDDLQLLQTPYGRFYLGEAQKVGTLWGLTP